MLKPAVAKFNVHRDKALEILGLSVDPTQFHSLKLNESGLLQDHIRQMTELWSATDLEQLRPYSSVWCKFSLTV